MRPARAHVALSVDTAAPGEMPLLGELLARYLEELREQLTDVCVTGAPPDLTVYRAGSRHLPLLFRCGQQAVGFALLDRGTTSRADSVIAEFGIIENHRRRGVASAALAVILERWPDRWRLCCHRRNAAAVAFWGVHAQRVRDMGAVVHFQLPVDDRRLRETR